MTMRVPPAQLYDLGRAALDLVLEHITEEIADPLIRALVQRLGPEALRAKVDYHAAALAAADAAADAKFPRGHGV